MTVPDQPRALSKQAVHFCRSQSQVALLQEQSSKETKRFLGVFSLLFLFLPQRKILVRAETSCRLNAACGPLFRQYSPV